MEVIIFIVFIAICVFTYGDFIIIHDIATNDLGNCPMWFAVFIAVCVTVSVIYLIVTLIRFLQSEIEIMRNKED